MLAHEGTLVPRPDTAEPDIIDAVQKCADELYAKGETDGAPWTEALLRTLRELGKKRKFYVCHQGFKAWIWDLCWIVGDERPGQGDFNGVALACEIEWDQAKGGSGRLEDFLKLTVCQDGHRLFVFNSGATRKTMNKRLDELVEASKWSTGKRYLVIALPPAKSRQSLKPTYLIWRT